eukprot:TRINITY_DN5721_c0_g1_i2.p1 TRINITY_DN5721_c0_g1~~TRINITY_DN5721_c0_g1_i2.p1  ORF type:complete len:507 (+),score=154.69 TRINITY_DN5721_c0_g1_i2:97-1617(+)
MRAARVAVSVCLAIGATNAKVRDVAERVTVNECVDSSTEVQLFPTERRTASISDIKVEKSTDMSFNLDVKYGSNFKVLTDTMAKEQYVLTQCGTTAPSTAAIDALSPKPDANYTRKSFTIPLQKMLPTGTVHLHFLESLEVMDRVSHVPGYAVGDCWQKARGCGAALENSFGGNATLRSEQMDNAEVVLMSCSSTTPLDCSNVNGKANAVHFAASQAEDTMKSAAYIKFMAAFFNKEREANEFYANLQSSMPSAPTTGAKPVVAWIAYESWSSSLVLSQAAYKLEIVTRAGGANKDGAAVRSQIGAGIMSESLAVPSNPAAGKTYKLPLSSFNGSLSDASAAFFAALTDVDVVIDETSIYPENPKTYNMTTFFEKLGLPSSASFGFLQKVFRIDGTLSAAGDYDWYESRLARPDWAANGLKRLLAPDATLPFRYFRDIAAGEASQEISQATCSVALPACGLDNAPVAIGVPAADKTTTEAEASTAAMATASVATAVVSAIISLFMF